MRFLLISFLLISTIPSLAQSRRVSPSATPTVPGIAADLTVKQMFDEANAYSKTKFAEFEEKKITYSERLRLQTEREQKQLAAKYATYASTRADLTSEDFYYAGLLHWIADNLE